MVQLIRQLPSALFLLVEDDFHQPAQIEATKG
jgi:hypothetical protein